MMNKLHTLLLAGALALAGAAPATAQVLTFDDIYTGGSYSYMAPGYGGFQWYNFHAIDRDYLPGTGYQTGNVSPRNSIFNAFGSPASISKPGDTFSFFSAYITSAWHNNNVVTVQSYLNGTLLYTQAVTAHTSGPQLFSFNMTGIDHLAFQSSNGQFVMDNANFENASVTPEPVSMALLGTGLAGLGAVRRRRKESDASDVA